MAIVAELRWEDENLVVHGVTSEMVMVRRPGKDSPQDRWVCLCKVRTFTRGFPPVFVDKKVTCVECLAAAE